jgi:hypothetical protein
VYPAFLDQLSPGGSILMLGMIVTGCIASVIVWQHRGRTSLPRRDRWVVAVLLALCAGCFVALIASLSAPGFS